MAFQGRYFCLTICSTTSVIVYIVFTQEKKDASAIFIRGVFRDRKSLENRKISYIILERCSSEVQLKKLAVMA